jgi:hypothetical protein
MDGRERKGLAGGLSSLELKRGGDWCGGDDYRREASLRLFIRR